MNPIPPTATASLAVSADEVRSFRRRDDLAYQAVTVAAILLVLGSVLLF
jgi:hypothetical protein